MPEDLNLKKMFGMLKELYRNYLLSYEGYRTIFNTQVGIAFGYPRTDTYSTCDQ